MSARDSSELLHAGLAEWSDTFLIMATSCSFPRNAKQMVCWDIARLVPGTPDPGCVPKYSKRLRVLLAAALLCCVLLIALISSLSANIPNFLYMYFCRQAYAPAACAAFPLHSVSKVAKQYAVLVS